MIMPHALIMPLPPPPHLRSVIKAKDPKGQLERWIEFLSTFDLEIQYRPEQRHQNAGVLSRDPIITVVRGVTVGNFMSVSKLQCMSLTRTLSNQRTVKLLLVIVVAQSS